jgi:hypothetical protein
LLQQENNKLGTPLDLVFHMIAQQIIRGVRERGETVAIVFDQDDATREDYFATFASQYKFTYYLGDAFAGFGFADSRKSSPLQAADLLAYGTHHLIQRIEAMPSYRGVDFPVIPAFWNMLNDLALSPLTSPNGEAINLAGLRDLVLKVRNREFLPKPNRLTVD